jgi:hypothetical protein
MNVRKCAAAAAGLLAATTIAGVGLSTAGAAGGLPIITGGGHTQNNNSTGNPDGPPFLTNYGGFNAHATEDQGDGSYLARGEVQGRSSDNETHKTTGKVHGNVVCIADLGAPTDETGGRSAEEGGGNVWEIRFEIERSDPELPGEGPFYGSIFVQDNGPHDDFSDESFDQDNILNPECGNIDQFQLEPHQGQITVH